MDRGKFEGLETGLVYSPCFWFTFLDFGEVHICGLTFHFNFL